MEKGPDAVGLDATRAALDYREANPEEAHRIRASVAARRQEEQDKELLRAAWLSQGGEEAAFNREYPRLRQDHERSKLEELDQGARGEAFRLMARSF